MSDKSSKNEKKSKRRGVQPGDKLVLRRKTKKHASLDGFTNVPQGNVGATRRLTSNTAAKKRMLIAHCENAQKALADDAIWSNEDTLMLAKAYMSALFFNRAEDVACGARLDTDTREHVQLIFSHYCKKSHVLGAYGQRTAWYTTMGNKRPRTNKEMAFIEATVEKARSLIYWGGLDDFTKKIIERIFEAYRVVETHGDYSLTECAFAEVKEHLTDEERGRVKPLRTAYNVAQSKLQAACNSLRAVRTPTNS